MSFLYRIAHASGLAHPLSTYTQHTHTHTHVRVRVETFGVGMLRDYTQTHAAISWVSFGHLHLRRHSIGHRISPSKCTAPLKCTAMLQGGTPHDHKIVHVYTITLYRPSDNRLHEYYGGTQHRQSSRRETRPARTAQHHIITIFWGGALRAPPPKKLPRMFSNLVGIVC
jgi:hypothetical protein